MNFIIIVILLLALGMLLRSRISSQPLTQLHWKIIEGFFALLALVILLPPLFLFWLFIRANSDGPVLFADEQISRDGKLNFIYRFRTTGRGTEVFHIFGRFLRKYSLDEFPALWNVVRGEITLKEFYR